MQPAAPSRAQGSTCSSTEEHLRLLIDTGLQLASQRDVDSIAQTALEAGLRLCGASFGAFFCALNDVAEEGEHVEVLKVCAAGPATLASFPPRTQASWDGDFLHHLKSGGVQRFDDINNSDASQSWAAAAAELFSGVIPGSPVTRSFMATPVRSAGGVFFGSMVYGAVESRVFDPGCEDIVTTIASQAALAIDNARLAATLSREIGLAEGSRKLQRDTAERLRQALDAAQLGTWSWDRTTDLLDLDERAAELLFAPAHAPVSRTALRERIVLQQDREMAVEDLRRALETGGYYAAEYQVDSPAGRQGWIAARGVATFNPDSSEITGMIGTVQDITERKNSEITLRQSEKLAATGRLAATIAHEINNPLEAVTNLIYLCKTDGSVPEPIRQLLETADHELARVSQIAQHTLGFYRESGQPVEIDMNDLLQRSVDLFARRMQAHHIRCTVDLEPGLCISGFPGQIRQVISNLLVNAIDASGNPGWIRLRGRHRSLKGVEGVSLVVADRGTGIPPNVRARLFSPFFTTKENVGTGLGLWVTRGIVEKQGGSISFRSQTEPPSGTVFRLFFPKAGPMSVVRQTAHGASQ